jgi:general secretion pathway protein A
VYENFFELTKNPFRMTPDPDLLFFTPAHREAFAGLTYSILSRKGFTVLTGDAGTGKTTLLTAILRSIPATRAHMSVLLNPTLTPAEFLELTLLQFGLTEVSPSKAQRLMALQRFLIESDVAGRVPVLIVDEAHKLSPEVLEEIRLLTNFETPEGKLLQIVLAGQGELNDVLNRTDMRQLKQRIAIRLSIRALTEPEIKQYMRYRWMKSGGAREIPFDDRSIAGITQASRGIPRVVNAICDNALLLAYGAGDKIVKFEQIQEALHDLELDNGHRRSTVPVVLSETQTGVSTGMRMAAGGNIQATPFAMKTLDRYQTQASSKPSLFARWTGKGGPSRVAR